MLQHLTRFSLNPNIRGHIYEAFFKLNLVKYKKCL